MARALVATHRARISRCYPGGCRKGGYERIGAIRALVRALRILGRRPSCRHEDAWSAARGLAVAAGNEKSKPRHGPRAPFRVEVLAQGSSHAPFLAVATWNRVAPAAEEPSVDQDASPGQDVDPAVELATRGALLFDPVATRDICALREHDPGGHIPAPSGGFALRRRSRRRRRPNRSSRDRPRRSQPPCADQRGRPRPRPAGCSRPAARSPRARHLPSPRPASRSRCSPSKRARTAACSPSGSSVNTSM
jgi:hypothetical protein